LETFTANVYFQPPTGKQMDYPCIVYKRRDSDTDFADNDPYRIQNRYEVTVIDEDPDSLIPAKVAGMKTALHNRFFIAGNLNHDVYVLYF